MWNLILTLFVILLSWYLFSLQKIIRIESVGFLSLCNITITLKQVIKIKKLTVYPGKKFVFHLNGTRVYVEKEESEKDVIKDTKRIVNQINQLCRIPLFIFSFFRIELNDLLVYFVDDFEYCLQVDEIILDTRVGNFS